MVVKEIWAHLLAHNLIRTVMAEAAACHGREPRTIGFKHAMQLWSAWLTAGVGLDAASRQLLCGRLVQRRVGNRPNRREPRANKKRPKPRALLKTPRAQARLECERYERR